MKNLLLLVLLALGAYSCENYEECTIPIVGVYESHIVGVSGPFDMTVSIKNNDNIQIDAPWLKDIWVVLDADTDGCLDNSAESDYKLDITIHHQDFDDGRYIEGKGFYTDYSIQLDYSIIDGGDKYNYTIVGSKK